MLRAVRRLHVTANAAAARHKLTTHYSAVPRDTDPRWKGARTPRTLPVVIPQLSEWVARGPLGVPHVPIYGVT